MHQLLIKWNFLSFKIWKPIQINTTGTGDYKRARKQRYGILLGKGLCSEGPTGGEQSHLPMLQGKNPFTSWHVLTLVRLLLWPHFLEEHKLGEISLIYSQLQNEGAKAQFPRLLRAEVHTWQAAEPEMATKSHSHSQTGRHAQLNLPAELAPRTGWCSPPPPPRGSAPEQSLANAFTLGARKGCPRRKFLPLKASSALDAKIICSNCPQSFAQYVIDALINKCA